MNKRLIILIPIYTSTLTEDEERSVRRLQKLCANRDICVVAPDGLPLPQMLSTYRVERWDAAYFSSIQGYNRLMMTAALYERFEAYEYILIYQPDAYIFHDDLDAWCNKGYDYAGAPWLVKRKYKGVGRCLLWLRSLPKRLQGKPFLALDYADKVGNGGFSLRKTAAFIQVCRTQAEQMEQWIERSRTCREYNEDCYWATRAGWHYPSAQEALLFSIDLAPQEAMKRNRGELPTGCHGWSKPQYRSFWLPIILKHE